MHIIPLEAHSVKLWKATSDCNPTWRSPLALC